MDRDPNAVGRRPFLKGSALAELFLLSPTAARAASKAGSKTAAKTATKTATKSTTKAATKSTSSTAVFDPTDELAVNFTFATSDGGFRVHNPTWLYSSRIRPAHSSAYELIRESVSIAGGPFTKKFADSGELQGASVELRSRG